MNMIEENQKDDDNSDLFKTVIDKILPFTRLQILRYYDEKDIIPIIEKLEQSGAEIVKITSFEFIRIFEENKISKKQKFASWMLNKHGTPKQTNGKI